MSTQYVAVWPITDPHMTLAALIEEAEDDLVDMAYADQVELIEPPTWQLRGRTLVATAPAEPMQLPPAFSGPLPWGSDREWLEYLMPDAA